jgi:hypothetical protein
MILKRLFGVGDSVVENYVEYRVRRAAVLDNVQIVNLDTEAESVVRALREET